MFYKYNFMNYKFNRESFKKYKKNLINNIIKKFILYF